MNNFGAKNCTLLTQNNNYVDEQIIKIKRSECFAESETYRYYNKNNDIKTVRAIDIINKKL